MPGLGPGDSDDLLAVLHRARLVDVTCSLEGIRRFLSELEEAAAQLQNVDVDDTVAPPLAFSPEWPEGAPN